MLTLVHRFSASVVMEVTYGYDLKGGETFVTSTKRAAEIFMSASTLKVFALCTAFPFGGLLPFGLVPCDCFLICVRCSEDAASVVPGYGVEVRGCRMPAFGVRRLEHSVYMD